MKNLKKTSKKFFQVALILIACFCFTSCMTLNHTVGTGAQNKSTPIASKNAWYILWGLVPLNADAVDGGKMAAAANAGSNYTIESQSTIVNFLLNILTSEITVYSQNVKIYK